MMKVFVCALLVGGVCLLVPSMGEKKSPPRVQIYSCAPGLADKENVLICHASGFYPPEIIIELLKDGMPIKGNQTDLAFEENWHYHLTKYAPFTPHKGENFACKSLICEIALPCLSFASPQEYKKIGMFCLILVAAIVKV